MADQKHRRVVRLTIGFGEGGQENFRVVEGERLTNRELMASGLAGFMKDQSTAHLTLTDELGESVILVQKSGILYLHEKLPTDEGGAS